MEYIKKLSQQRACTYIAIVQIVTNIEAVIRQMIPSIILINIEWSKLNLLFVQGCH